MNKKFLKNLKVGDKVIVGSNYQSRIHQVERLTKTQIVVDNQKFNRETGRLVSSDVWSSVYLYECTEEKANEIRRSNKIRKIKNYGWFKISDNELDQVIEILFRKETK